MRIIYILVSLLAFSLGLTAQCPSSSLTLTTQAQVDAFPTTYSGCTNMSVSLTLDGSGITNLNGIGALTNIGGTLVIKNTSVTTLAPLANLVSIGQWLEIENNDQLPNLTGLTNMKSSLSSLTVSGNQILTDLNGLSGLNTASGTTQSGFQLFVNDNPALTSIAAMSVLTGTVSKIEVKNNALLPSLAGIQNLTNITNTLDIENNPELTSWNLPNITAINQLYCVNNDKIPNLNIFSALTTIPGGLYISKNALITNLVGLNNVTSVGQCRIQENAELLTIDLTKLLSADDLYIQDNPKLTTLGGLAMFTNTNAGSANSIFIDRNVALLDVNMTSLTTVNGQISIAGSPLLTNVNGLSSLTTITSSLSVGTCNTLTSLTALSNITSLGGELAITANPLLTSLAGLQGITNLNNNRLLIRDNIILTDISAVQNIVHTSINQLSIQGNSQLAVCHITNVCSFIELPANSAKISIFGNNSTCASKASVVNACCALGGGTAPTFTGLSNTSTTGTNQTLTGNPTGGTFTGPGITGNSFSPSAAGAGTHTISYTAMVGACNLTGTQQVVVSLNNCATQPVCSTLTATSGLPATIPSTVGEGAPILFTFPSDVQITDINIIDIIGSHPYGQEVRLSLESPDGNKKYIHYNSCVNGTTSFNLDIDDGYTVTAPADCGTNGKKVGGHSRDAGGNRTLGTYNGKNAKGVWKLYVEDSVNGDGGTLTGAKLQICGRPITAAFTLQDNICKTAVPITLAATPAGGVFSGPGVTGTMFDPSALALGAHVITYMVNDAACNAVQFSVTETITVITGTAPTAAIASSDVDNMICSGASVTLTASGGATYKWSTGETTAAITKSPTTTTTYTVTVTNATGCFASTSQVVTVNPSPTAAIGSNDADNTICSGASIILTASGGATYLWSTGETTAAITKTPTTNTTYMVTVTSGAGCTAAASQLVTVNAAPSAAIASSDADNTICSTSSITLTASGGASYVWSSGETTAAISKTPTATITYSVTVTDGNGCTALASQAVTVNPSPTAAIASSDTDNTICSGTNVTLTASGGATYVWSSGETTAAITKTPTATMTYGVTVTDGNGCTAVASQVVTVNPSPTAAIGSNDADNTICSGASIILTASGGATYLWSTGETTAAITKTPTTNTTYMVTVTSGAGCTATASQLVSVNANAPAAISSSDADNTICSASSITLTASGGASYVWSTGETTAAITKTPTATITYSVTVTDGGGCTGSASQQVTVNPTPTGTIATNDADNTICSGSSILLTASGGATYLWSSGETTAAITKTPTATTTYTVTVTDGNGCTGTATQIVTVNPAPTAAIATNDADNTICSGSSIILTASGGATYLWNTGETTAAVTKTPAANTTYMVTVTSAAGCTAIASQLVSVNANAPAAIATNDADNTICSGSSVILTASGGATYLWSTGETTAAITKTPTATITYSVTVTDGGGCTGSASQQVTVNPTPTGTIATNDADNTICSGSSILLTASGGATYLWSSGETTAAITKTPTATTTYTVTVTDGNGCTGTATQIVTVNPAPAAAIATNDADNTICSGSSIILTASGGATYLWNTGETTAAITKTPTANTTYMVTVTSAAGCTAIASQLVSVNANAPAAIATNDADNTICSGSSVILTASGGATYLWSTGETTAAITKTPTATITYSVTVTDGGGCTGSASQQVTVNPTPTGTIATNDADNTICSGSSILLTASGGATYLWSTSETTAAITKTPTATTTYTVTVTDGNGCTGTATQIVTVNPAPTAAIATNDADNTICSGSSIILTASGGATYLWNTGETTAAVTKTPTANTTYMVTVTSAAGCTAIASQVVSVNANAPAAIATNDADNTICSGSSVILTASGGATYLWSTGETTATITKTPTATITYNVTVTDAGGCTGSASQQVTVNTAPTAAIASSDTDNTVCSGTSITLTATGGATYVWSTGETTAAITKTPTATMTYGVTVTDGNGCTAVASQVVTVNPSPTAAIGSNDADNTICSGASIILTASGGATYIWSTGETTAAITKTPTTNTTYMVTVTVANGCTAIASQIITVNPVPTAAIASSDPDNTLCSGSSVTLTASNGTSYLWSSGETTAAINKTVTAAATYTVTVTNASGCTATASQQVMVHTTPTAAIASSDADNTICSGASVTLTASGGSTYTWSSGETTAVITKTLTSTTNYIVTITDANGCTATASQQVTVNPLPTPTIASTDTDNTICSGSSVTLTASGGASYAWSTNETTATITASPTTATTYAVTVTDANGCTASTNQVVSINALPTATIQSSDNDNTVCAGSSLTLTASGGAIYLWSTGETTAAITQSPTATTIYTVTVTDGNGCTAITSQSITSASLPTIAASNATCSTNLQTWSVNITTENGATLSSTAGTISGNAPNYTISGIPAGTNITITATNTTTGCVTTLASTAPNCNCPVVNPPSNPVNKTICFGESATPISVTVGTGETVNWYSAQSGGTPLITGNTAYTPTVTAVGNYTFYAETINTTSNCTSTSRTPVTYVINSLPAVTITSTDGDNTTCAGQSLTLTATGGGIYAWSTGSTNASLTVSPTTTTTYSVTVTGNNGCKSIASQVVTVNALPAGKVVSNDSDNTICKGGSVTLTAQGGSSYLWSTGASTATVTVSPQANTTYTVTVTNTLGCNTIVSQLVSIHPDPILTTESTECSANLLTYTAKIKGTNVSTLTSTHGTVAKDGSNFVVSNIPKGQAIVLTGSNATTNCSVTLNVNAPSCECPMVDAPKPAADQSICFGQKVQALQVTVGSNLLAEWYDAPTGGSKVFTGGSYTPSQTAVGVYNFYVESRDSISNCKSKTRSVVKLTIKESPTGKITTTDPDNTLCSGSSITLRASGGASYLWSNSSMNDSLSVRPTASVDFSVTVTGASGCTDTIVQKLTVNPLPNINLLLPDTICSGVSFNIIENGGNATKWAWTLDATTKDLGDTLSVQGGTLKNPNLSLTITDANGCSSSTIRNISTIQSPVFQSKFLVPSSVCVGDSLKLLEHSELSFTPSKITWNFGDGNVSSKTYPVHKYSRAGSYEVDVTVWNSACKSTSIKKKVSVNNCLVTGVAQENEIQISPNPILRNEAIRIRGRSLTKQDVQLSIHDLTGQTLFTKRIAAVNVIDEKVPMYLESGMYIVKVGWLLSKEVKVQSLIVME